MLTVDNFSYCIDKFVYIDCSNIYKLYIYLRHLDIFTKVSNKKTELPLNPQRVHDDYENDD